MKSTDSQTKSWTSDQRTPAAELAKKAGCSPETVRKAIRELQQQGVVENLRVGYAVTSDSSQITAYRQRYLISIKEEEIKQPIEIWCVRRDSVFGRAYTKCLLSCQAKRALF